MIGPGAMRDADFSRIAFFAALATFLVGGVFAFGLYSGVKRNAVYRVVNSAVDTAALATDEWQNHMANGDPIHFLQKARNDGNGVTINELGDDRRVVLITSFFDGLPEVRLIRRDGTVLAKWRAAYSQIFPDWEHPDRPQTDWNVDLHGVVAMPDGSVVVNFETNGTVRLSRCGKIEWKLDRVTHHSIERSEKGGFWIPSTRFLPGPDSPDYVDAFPPFTEMQNWESYRDDTLMHVSDDGEVLEEVSLMRIFYDNGMKPLMTATGSFFFRDGKWDTELLHLNKIAELSRDMAGAFPMFEAGDLLVSARQYNLLAVIDPDTWKVKWHQTGPWIRQHDPEFRSDGTISVFNNNAFFTWHQGDGKLVPGTPLTSSVMTVSPATEEVTEDYGNRPGQEFRSVARGKVDPLPNGNVLITEFEAGRAFEVDPSGRTVWEYINRYDETRVLEITEARTYPKSYFNVPDWSCQN